MASYSTNLSMRTFSWSLFGIVRHQVAMLPVLFVLGVTAIKDAYEDRRRYLSDNKINHQTCRVFVGGARGRYVKKTWQNVKVRLHSGVELAPALEGKWMIWCLKTTWFCPTVGWLPVLTWGSTLLSLVIWEISLVRSATLCTCPATRSFRRTSCCSTHPTMKGFVTPKPLPSMENPISNNARSLRSVCHIGKLSKKCNHHVQLFPIHLLHLLLLSCYILVFPFYLIKDFFRRFNEFDPAEFQSTVECERPNNQIHKFTGGLIFLNFFGALFWLGFGLK